MDGQADRQMDRPTDNRQADLWIDRQIGQQINRLMDRRIDSWRGRLDREIDIQRDREIEKQRYGLKGVMPWFKYKR